MTNLIPIRTADLGPGEAKKPPRDRLIEGDPDLEVWTQGTAMGGKVRSGVATSTTGTTRTIKGETCEVVQLKAGVVELTEDGGETMTFRAGDVFMMKPGFVGTWKTVDDIRKVFVIIEP